MVYTAIEFYKESCFFVRVLKSKRLRSPSRPTTNQEVSEKPTGSFQHAFTRVFRRNFLIFRFFVYGFTGGISTPKWFTEIEQDFISGFHFQVSRRLVRSRVIGEGWTPTIGITEIWQASPATYLLWLICVHPSPIFCRRNSRSWNLEERTGDSPPDLFPAWFCFWGVVFFVLNGHFWFFLFYPKMKGTILGGGYKFDSSKATSLSILILNRNWKNSKQNVICLVNPATTS